jgi:hypothetical protein
MFFSHVTLGLALGCAAVAIPSMMAQSTWQPSHAGIGFGAPQGKQWVQMVSSPDLAVKSGKRAHSRQDAELRFAIQSGLHINSHTPHSRFLIPTTLTLSQSAGVEIVNIKFPPGVDYHFRFSPKDALSVYTGEFEVLIQVHARPGNYALHGQLHYQACDDRTCNPPKTLPITLNVTAE